MTPESGLVFFLAIFVFSITPGPGVFALLARALSQGAWSCVSLALGMAISDIIYLVMACLGLAVVAEHWGGVFTAIRIIGAIYLIYLGWKIWQDRSHLVDSERKPTARCSEWLSFMQGFLISASNPKVILFYIAFLPTFMDLTLLSANDIIIASLLCLAGLMTGLMSVAYSAAWARSYFRSARAMTGLNRIAGSIMISAGVYLGTRH
jgi:threonine/homoserine/homoserine lactone efflux protein